MDPQRGRAQGRLRALRVESPRSPNASSDARILPQPCGIPCSVPLSSDLCGGTPHVGSVYPTWTAPSPSRRSRSSLSSRSHRGRGRLRGADGRCRRRVVAGCGHLEPGREQAPRHPVLLLGSEDGDHDRAEPRGVLVPDGVEPLDRGEGVGPPRDRRSSRRARARRRKKAARVDMAKQLATRGRPPGRRHRAHVPPRARGHARVPAHPDGHDAREPRLHEGRRGLQRRQPARRASTSASSTRCTSPAAPARRARSRPAPTRSTSSAPRASTTRAARSSEVGERRREEPRDQRQACSQVPEGLPHADLRVEAHDDARRRSRQLGKIILERGHDGSCRCTAPSSRGTCSRSRTAPTPRSAAAGPEGAACVKPVFAPMQLAATDARVDRPRRGPARLDPRRSAGRPRRASSRRSSSPATPARLSSGHRAVAEQVAPLMAGLAQYYGARAQGATVEMTERRRRLSSTPACRTCRTTRRRRSS